MTKPPGAVKYHTYGGGNTRLSIAKELCAAGDMRFAQLYVVTGLDTREYKIIAAGPTTSIREEPYQADVMKHFNVKGVIGKGGMGAKTLKGCEETPGVYFHAIGGAASFLAQTVKKVHGVFKLDFGVPEAMWVIEVKDFPVVVTMDSHGGSQHLVIDDSSKKVCNSPCPCLRVVR